jgi:hypothetical protein
MPTFNFKAQFVEPIENGTKGGTIRAYRKYPCRVGQTMYLATGPRFKPIRIKEVPCVEVWNVMIMENKIILKSSVEMTMLDGMSLPGITVVLDTATELNAFAKTDGFESFGEMKKFWDGGLPFEGFNARWIPLKQHLNLTY